MEAIHGEVGGVFCFSIQNILIKYKLAFLV